MQGESHLTPREVAEAILVQPAERGKLVSYARSRFGICGNDAEDLLQETALELLRQRSYVRSPEAFVFTVFRARCSRFIGAQKARRAVIRVDEPGGDAPDPLGSDHFDRKVALHQALAQISSACRRFLSAYYVEGENLTEVARRLSLAYSSASTTLSRCLKKLRECLS